MPAHLCRNLCKMRGIRPETVGLMGASVEQTDLKSSAVLPIFPTEPVGRLVEDAGVLGRMGTTIPALQRLVDGLGTRRNLPPVANPGPRLGGASRQADLRPAGISPFTLFCPEGGYPTWTIRPTLQGRVPRICDRKKFFVGNRIYTL